jgi:ribosomal protein S18 acetylase RimI-like enzyme
MTDLAAIEACETRLVNLWPAVDTLLIGDWVLRFANGYSGRANSASAIRSGADLGEADLALIARLYRAAGLQPAIRLTPLASPGLEPRLLAGGWRLRTSSIGMRTPARPAWRAAPEVIIDSTPQAHWLDGISALQEPSKSQPDHLAAIVGRIRLPVGFATLREADTPAAFGMAALDRGWAEIGSIITRPEARGKGLGRKLVTSLLHWAVENGAEQVFLQVEASNEPAKTLYRSLGFADLYAYREYRLA